MPMKNSLGVQAGRLRYAVPLILILLFLSCTREQPLAPEPLLLSYSGTVVTGAENVPWTGESGMLVFNVVKNHGKREAIVPVAAAYDKYSLAFIAQGRGQLTNKVNPELFVPLDRVRYIGEGQELESLVFVPVNFREHPFVFVEWLFIRENEEFVF